MENYTIAETYSLPSKGEVYAQQVGPKVRLRSMTTEEEMKRLGHSEAPNELLAEIINDCLVEKLPIHVYDLCVADYQYLMHKLRVVTYGPNYKVSTVCPICGKVNNDSIDLEKLDLVEFSEEMKAHLNITLPKTGKNIELRLQTPRMLDEAFAKSKDLVNKSNTKSEPAILFNIVSMIAKVDGKVIDEFKLDSFVRKLPMKDTNFILNHIKAINFGLSTNIKCKCKSCHTEYESRLPITGEFFGPTDY